MATLQKTQGSATQAKRAKPAPATKAAPAPTGSPAITGDLIATRAYEIWQERGCPEGLDLEHWFQAERELREVHDE